MCLRSEESLKNIISTFKNHLWSIPEKFSNKNVHNNNDTLSLQTKNSKSIIFFPVRLSLKKTKIKNQNTGTHTNVPICLYIIYILCIKIHIGFIKV